MTKRIMCINNSEAFRRLGLRSCTNARLSLLEARFSPPLHKSDIWRHELLSVISMQLLKINDRFLIAFVKILDNFQQI